jgi:dGTPase
MNWKQLLAVDRLSGNEDERDAPRSPFQRDYDRVLYSSAFRRLGDKTQVFPVPLDDHIHTRLTHSLEVATIGRSLGTLAGRHIAASAGLPAGLGERDIGDCVAAACLAHDLGNPPFGHVGEDAFHEFFATFFESRRGEAWQAELDAAQMQDLRCFEGNAQSLRIVTKLARPTASHGLDLTCSTLGALVKYPCVSTASLGKDGGSTSRSKHGINQSELPVFREVAARTGLPAADAGAVAWTRHPLAYLTEAADDVAYRIIDFEDGLRLALIEPALFVELLRPLCEGERRCPALEVPRGREALFDLALTLRGIALGRLIREAAAVFAARQAEILAGSFDESLLAHIPSRAAVERIEGVTLELCYRARDVLKMELSGAVAIEGVLDALAAAAVEKRSLRARHLTRLLPGVLKAPDLYGRLLRVTDHVSGMTDNYLVRYYRELSGIRLPGGRD